MHPLKNIIEKISGWVVQTPADFSRSYEIRRQREYTPQDYRRAVD